jgi:2-iminobutanoate/2-iminopropanoate deaminase
MYPHIFLSWSDVSSSIIPFAETPQELLVSCILKFMQDTKAAAAFGLPYSTVFKAGDYYYISGHTGVDIPTKTASQNIQEQTTKVFENLADTMQAHGLSFTDIVKTTLFLTDMDDFSEVNEVYVTYFNDPKPARTTVAVRELPRVANVPLKVEIEAVAYKQTT